MQLLPYAILDMDGTLLDSSGMWDRVAVQVLAPWGVTYTPAERDDTMTMTIDGTAAYFVQRFSLPVSPAAGRLARPRRPPVRCVRHREGAGGRRAGPFRAAGPV